MRSLLDPEAAHDWGGGCRRLNREPSEGALGLSCQRQRLDPSTQGGRLLAHIHLQVHCEARGGSGKGGVTEWRLEEDGLIRPAHDDGVATPDICRASEGPAEPPHGESLLTTAIAGRSLHTKAGVAPKTRLGGT
ncbi:hypothetical protein GHT09_007637 [Marmota monax]|uniref:Uncharacterized protein n=1 Tax=Marmota monax TaxID=9995 RepID=A0A834UR46_MARMO|nr:hypothetical protein GHT09_007637 [Marmota monax]